MGVARAAPSPAQGNTGTRDENNPNSADDEYNPEKPAFEQAE